MNITAQSIKAWQKNTPQAFFAWLSDVKPKILHRSGKYEVFKPTDKQKIVINQILKSKNNQFIHELSLNIAPRRHSKSTIFALIILFQYEFNINIYLFDNNLKVIAKTPSGYSFFKGGIQQFQIYHDHNKRPTVKVFNDIETILVALEKKPYFLINKEIKIILRTSTIYMLSKRSCVIHVVF